MRRVRGMWLACVCVCVCLLVGCQRSKPPDAPLTENTSPSPAQAAASTASPLTIALAGPVGARQEAVPEQPFEWVAANCGAQEARVISAMQAITLCVECELDMDAAPPQAQPYRAQMQATLLRLYGQMEDVPRVYQQPVSMTVPAHTMGTQPLVWHKIYDQNEIVMHQDGQVVARVPVRVLRSAQLVAGDVQQMPCEGTLSGATQIADANQRKVPTLESASQASQGEPGSPEAIALVREYLALLDQGRLADAYALLDQGYQVRMPLDAYLRGYAPVERVQLLGLMVGQQQDGRESGQALLRITARQVDATVVGDWLAEFEIVDAPHQLPFARSIANVRVKRVVIEE